jgi:hypothetical protein
MSNIFAQDLDTDSADIKLGNLFIWIHGYQFPECQDYWDGNWVNLTAYCTSGCASVRVSGFFLHLPELKDWYQQTKRLYETLKGEAVLKCMEPNLGVSLTTNGRGGISATVSITPDHLMENHEFKFDWDQTYLKTFLKDCQTVLEKYPIRGTPIHYMKKLVRSLKKS